MHPGCNYGIHNYLPRSPALTTCRSDCIYGLVTGAAVAKALIVLSRFFFTICIVAVSLVVNGGAAADERLLSHLGSCDTAMGNLLNLVTSRGVISNSNVYILYPVLADINRLVERRTV